MEIDARNLLRILPHRYPFLLVDRILEVDEGKRAVGLKNVTTNEWFFAGHFPEHPIMPGVLIIEMMAQAGAVMLLGAEGYQGKLPYLAGVEKARFKKPVRPGDTLIAEVEMVKSRGMVGWVKATARVGDEIVCEAELSFALVEKEQVGA